jgi:hypothetical protein
VLFPLPEANSTAKLNQRARTKKDANPKKHDVLARCEMGNDFDPMEFGKVIQRLNYQDEEIRALRDDVKHLVSLANQGKGSLMALTTVGALVGSVITWLATHLWK